MFWVQVHHKKAAHVRFFFLRKNVFDEFEKSNFLNKKRKSDPSLIYPYKLPPAGKLKRKLSWPTLIYIKRTLVLLLMKLDGQPFDQPPVPEPPVHLTNHTAFQILFTVLPLSNDKR